MKIFGREPAAWSGLVEATLMLLVAVRIIALSAEQTGLVLACVSAALAVYVAWVTTRTMLAVVVGFAKAVLALLVGFGLDLQPDQTAALLAFVAVAVGFFQRTQTSPLPAPTFREPSV